MTDIIPETFTIVLDDTQRDFLIRLLNGDRVDGDDESARVELLAMLTSAESGDVVNGFTL